MRSTRRWSTRWALLIGVTALTTAACTSENASTDATDSAVSTEAPTTTRPDPTTTRPDPTTTTAAATTTTIPPPAVYPLTGVVVDNVLAFARPALVVKIDNAPGARPQTGFNSADIVVEEIVNDNLTRFAMVFHSQNSNPVGPIRSGRLQDIDLFSAFNRPLFAWSGGNATVTDAIRNSDLRDIGPSRSGAYYRSNDRNVPHNLYATTDGLWAETPPDAEPPLQQYTYREPGEAPSGGGPTAAIEVTLDSIDVVWRWNAATGLYEREMEGRPHLDDATDTVVTTHNVIVIEVPYTPGISGSPDAQTIGSGRVWILTGGTGYVGTWERSDARSPFAFFDQDGNVIKLTPGRSFIELPRADTGAVTPVVG